MKPNHSGTPRWLAFLRAPPIWYYFVLFIVVVPWVYQLTLSWYIGVNVFVNLLLWPRISFAPFRKFKYIQFSLKGLVLSVFTLQIPIVLLVTGKSGVVYAIAGGLLFVWGLVLYAVLEGQIRDGSEKEKALRATAESTDIS